MKRTIISLLVMLGLMVTPVLGAAQPTEEDTTFTSEYSGEIFDIGASGDVIFLEDLYSTNEYQGGWEEFIWMSAGYSNFQLILVGGDNNTTEYYTDVTIQNMDEYYQNWEVIDQDVNEDEAFFIGSAELDGDPVVIYYHFILDAYGNTDFGFMQFSWGGTLADDLEVIQDEVTINGEPILEDVDAAEIEGMVPGSTPSGDDEDASPVSTPADDDAVEEDDDLGIPVDGLDDSTTPEATTDEDASAGMDWESMGLVSDSEWESPTFGNAIEWDTNWLFPEDYEYAIIVNEDPVYDSLTLETTDGLGYVFINVEEVGPTTPQSQAEYWNSPEFAGRYENGFELVEVSTTRNTATVIYETLNNADQELYVVLTASFMDDGTVIYNQISAAPDTIGDVYEQYVEGVTLDGAPVNMTYTVDEIYEISGN